MKSRLFNLSILIISLAGLLTWTVFAQEPVLEETGKENSPANPLPLAQETESSFTYQPSSIPAVRQVNASTALGQPGTSFRYVATFGVPDEGYLADTQHINAPAGLFIDETDNLYLVEDRGSRLLKFNPAGVNTLTIGIAGLLNRAEDSFNQLTDVALDHNGNIWVVDRHRAAQYNPNGTFLQEWPPDDPWNSGSDNIHFNAPWGITFDSANRMYVSDRYNHRLQVYTFSNGLLGGSPVYSTTIGETGVSGSDNEHFNTPRRIVIDANDRLYVVDQHNDRVQRCTYSGTGWTCTPFATDLNAPTGISLDVNGAIYIADSGNARVRKCNSAGVCTDLITGLTFWAPDVAVDSAGNIYLSDSTLHRVQKYDANGVFQATFVGVANTPYQTDTSRYNSPWGVAIASDGSLYISEDYGYRLLKLDATGTQQWAIGQAGVPGDDDAHFGDFWRGATGIAVDPDDNVYVADPANQRVQIFDRNGAWIGRLGITREAGSDDTHFNAPHDVALDSNGNIYVADQNNNRIQKCTRNGAGGACTTFAASLSAPNSVTLDGAGNVFVGQDKDNQIQKCTPGGVCGPFVGVKGEGGSDFNHLSSSFGLVVDTQGRVYVADTWNARVQVFDSSGAYLTTIGGAWGNKTGQARNPRGLALDQAGNLYIADSTAHRIQKYAPGVPGWRQVNINGFGDPNIPRILALEIFQGYLYAATETRADGAKRLFRSSDGLSWTEVIGVDFGRKYNYALGDLIEFKNQLYAGTWNYNWEADQVEGAEIWRSSDGLSWTPVMTGGFGAPDLGSIYQFGLWQNQLYAFTSSAGNGCQIWRTSSGDSDAWQQVAGDGLGDANNGSVNTLETFAGQWYLGTFNDTTGAEIWRSSDGSQWTQVNADGFGEANNSAISTLEVFNGYLYASTRNLTDGGQIWRSADGATWSKVSADGFGNAQNKRVYGLTVWEEKLYVVAGNDETGAEVWRSVDGLTWSRVIGGGWGDSNNTITNYDGALIDFNGQRLIGLSNWTNGAEIWRMLETIYVPGVLR